MADLTALTVDPEASGSMRDLDADMDAALSQAGLCAEELPEFAASNSSAPASAAETRVAFDTEMPQEDDEDDLEGLFVDLVKE